MTSTRSGAVNIITSALIALVTTAFYAAVFSRQGTVAPLSPDWSSGIYGVGLRDHFWEYISFSPLKPPLFSMIHALVLKLSDFFAMSEALAFTIFGFGLNIAVAPLLFWASVYLGADRWSASFFAILAGLSLIPISQDPVNYDFPVFFLLSLLLYSVGRFVWENSTGNAFLLSISAALVVAQSTVQAPIVPISLAVLLLLTKSHQKFGRRVVQTAGVLFLPLLVVGVVAAKNSMVFGVVTNSTLGNPNLMRYSLYVNNLDNPDNKDLWREAAVKAEAPDWYLWCYDNPADWRESGPAAWYMRTMGHCFDNGEQGFELADLQREMEEMGAKTPAAVIALDIADFENRPFIFHGVSADMATRWFALYGQVSGRVAWYIFKKDPWAWLERAKQVHGDFFAQPDFEFLLERLANFDYYQGLTRLIIEQVLVVSKWSRYLTYRALPFLWLFLGLVGLSAFLLSQKMSPIDLQNRSAAVRAGIVSAVTLIISVGFLLPVFDWFYFGWPSALYLLPFIMVLILSLSLYWMTGFEVTREFSSVCISRLASEKKHMPGLVYLLSVVTMTALVFSIVVDSENNRFFLQLLPHLCVLIAVFLSLGLRLLRHRTAVR